MGCISATSKRNKTAPTNAYLTLEEVRPGRNLRVLYIKPTTKLVDDQLENNKKQNNATEETLSPELTTSLEQQTVFKKSDCELIKINNELTLFFFHGVGGSCETWQNQFDHFIDYKIVAVDFIGHGHSSISNKKEDYAFNEILDDLLVVFDKYASNKNILIGHSYGYVCFC